MENEESPFFNLDFLNPHKETTETLCFCRFLFGSAQSGHTQENINSYRTRALGSFAILIRLTVFHRENMILRSRRADSLASDA